MGGPDGWHGWQHHGVRENDACICAILLQPYMPASPGRSNEHIGMRTTSTVQGSDGSRFQGSEGAMQRGAEGKGHVNMPEGRQCGDFIAVPAEVSGACAVLATGCVCCRAADSDDTRAAG